MSDAFYLDIGQGVIARSGNWYKNIQFLGQGGNAVTFLVLSTAGRYKGSLFALKVFRKLSAPERRVKFLEEISFLQECNHPSIMRVYDEGDFNTGGLTYPFVVAEYLPITLAQLSYNNLTLIDKLSYSLQLLSAVASLQSLTPPVVHRDIKPPNIFIKGRSCVLGDFGLMKRLDDVDEIDRKVLKQSMGPGMPYYYRTPDLVSYARNECVLTPKTDVFQLGLVLAEMFTGKNPCKACRDILSPVELYELDYIRGSLGGSIAALLKRMLDHNVDRRPYAADLVNPWEMNFMDAVQASHMLEGQVFPPITIK